MTLVEPPPLKVEELVDPRNDSFALAANDPVSAVVSPSGLRTCSSYGGLLRVSVGERLSVIVLVAEGLREWPWEEVTQSLYPVISSAACATPQGGMTVEILER